MTLLHVLENLDGCFVVNSVDLFLKISSSVLQKVSRQP